MAVTDRVISVRLQLEVDRARRDAKAFGGTIQGVATTADKSGKSLSQLGTSTKGAGKELAALGATNRNLAGVGLSLKGIASAGAAVAAVSIFKSIVGEAREAERTTRQTEAVLKSTGGAANVTADQVSGLADKLSAKTAVDDEVVAHGENVLLTFKNIRNEAGRGNDIFNQTAAVALDMSAALSQSGDASEGLQSNSVRLGKALNDPIAGISALTRVGVTFTEKQKAQIRALTESGDIMGAQKMILTELTSEFGGMGAASADSLGKTEVSWKNFAESLGQKVMPAVNAVSDWALHTGLPALGSVADTVGDVVVPAFHGLMSVGGGLVGIWQSLPGPIQAGAIAMGIWALAGDKVTGFFTRTAGPLRTFGDEMRLQQGLASQTGQDIGRFGASVAVLESKIPAVGRMGEAFRTAKGDVSGFGSTLKGVAMAGLSGLRSAAGGLVGFLGGPWGIALAGAAVLLGALKSNSDRAAAEQQRLADAGKSVARAIAEENGAINGNVRAKAAQAAEDAGLLAGAERFGISTTQVTDAIVGQKGAYEALRGQLDAYIQRHSSVESGEGGAVTVFDQEGAAAIKLRDNLQEVVGAKDGDVAASQRVAAATQTTAAAHATGTTSSELYRQAIERAGLEYDETAGLAEQLKAAIDALTAAEMARMDTLESYEAAQDALTSSVDANGHSLDIHTEAGRKNRDALEDVAKRSRDLMQADIDSGVPMGQALQRHNDRIAALKKEADKTFTAKGEARKLIDMYGKIPKDVRTAIKVEGYEAANRRMMDLSAKQTALEHGVTIGSKGYQTYVRQINKEKGFQRAAGGPIHGPGTKTSDSIPLWASTGEYMQQASAVDYYGMGFMNAVNQKRFPKAIAQGLAGGGAVTWPFPVTVKNTKIPEFVPAFVGGSAVAGSPAVIAAVRAAASRYGWGSGGQWNALSQLITGESGWNPNAQNPTSTAYGLFQFLDSTWAGTGFAKSSSPAVQAAAGMVYLRSRYGSPAAAYGAWSSRSPHWYAHGGPVKGGDGAFAGLGDFMRGTYRRGTDRVPMDGLYQLHRGEKVTAAGQNRGGEAVLTIRSDGTPWSVAVVDAIHKADKTGQLQLTVRSG